MKNDNTTNDAHDVKTSGAQRRINLDSPLGFFANAMTITTFMAANIEQAAKKEKISVPRDREGAYRSLADAMGYTLGEYQYSPFNPMYSTAVIRPKQNAQTQIINMKGGTQK